MKNSQWMWCDEKRNIHEEYSGYMEDGRLPWEGFEAEELVYESEQKLGCDQNTALNLTSWITHAIGLSDTKAATHPETAWQCKTCTFRHEAELSALLQCSMCDTPRSTEGNENGFMNKIDEFDPNCEEHVEALTAELSSQLTESEFTNVLEWLEETASDASTWDEVGSSTSEWSCVPDDAFSACSDFTVLELTEDEECMPDKERAPDNEPVRMNARNARRARKSAERAAEYAKRSYTCGGDHKRGTVLEQQERRTGMSAEEVLRMTELRRMLKKRFNLIIGHGRGIDEVERVAMIKQRQAIRQSIKNMRNRAASIQAKGRSACRAVKAHLDVNERKRFAEEEHTYLITQVHEVLPADEAH
jgi:hypothetical protein